MGLENRVAKRRTSSPFGTEGAGPEATDGSAGASACRFMFLATAARTLSFPTQARRFITSTGVLGFSATPGALGPFVAPTCPLFWMLLLDVDPGQKTVRAAGSRLRCV